MEGPISDGPFRFTPEAPSRRPRAWERVQRASFASRHRGRKVWKRYELRQNNRSHLNNDPTSSRYTDENVDTNAGTPSRRPIKRLRKAARLGNTEGATDATQYITTLHEKALATPKSRQIFAMMPGE